jgi:hypothetical protein
MNGYETNLAAAIGKKQSHRTTQRMFVIFAERNGIVFDDHTASLTRSNKMFDRYRQVGLAEVIGDRTGGPL